MKNVKAISIPEGSVKKIEDSNGNTLWGSQDAFPYRRLEYIHFNEAEYIDSGIIPAVSKTYAIKALFETGTKAWNRLFGAYDGNLNNAARRFNISGSNSQNTTFVVGNLWEQSTESLDTTNIRWYSISCNAAFKRFWLYIRSSDNATSIYYKQLDTTVALTGYNVSLAIGTNKGNGGSLDQTAFAKAKVYAFQVKSGSMTTGTIINNFIPCQRKSDGVCGLYDVMNNVFKPMQGTTITDAAAGPTVDEYWDLTA